MIGRQNKGGRLRTAVTGLTLMAGAAGLGAGVAAEAVDAGMPNAIVTEAMPSDDMSNYFDVAVNVGALAGGIFLAERGVKRVRIGMDESLYAAHQLALRQGTHPGKSRRRFAAVSLLASGAAVAVGNLVDIAEGVGTSQSDVAAAVSDIAGTDPEHTFIVTNSPQPELLSSPNIPVGPATNAIEASEGTLIPAVWEWRTATKKNIDAKYTVLTMGLPQEITELPVSAEDCSEISVAAAQELGVKKGQTFQVDGVTMKVDQVLTGKSGLNVLPVLLNNQDYARCLKGNPDQAFSFLLGNGEQESIEGLLRAEGLEQNPEDLSQRAYVVPVSEFIAQSEQSGKNSVNPLVLEAAFVTSLLAGAALAGRASTRMANGRNSNSVLFASGTSKKSIANMYRELADSEAEVAGLIAAPLILLVDAFTNSGIPGAELGPSVKTVLFVTGLTWASNRIGTGLALRREIPQIDPSKVIA